MGATSTQAGEDDEAKLQEGTGEARNPSSLSRYDQAPLS